MFPKDVCFERSTKVGVSTPRSGRSLPQTGSDRKAKRTLHVEVHEQRPSQHGELLLGNTCRTCGPLTCCFRDFRCDPGPGLQHERVLTLTVEPRWSSRCCSSSLVSLTQREL
ncbi:hypothetical protein EYF80_067314 [Liparis tanakae]|uniref:Uncharacterized protein n=1 Tax=Liparis tanakae TaxID=230148 RepID=A0A4Z2E2H0_9TELE|nr:hypothetical protein EYF80_067314 [Liparis tanakae]